MDLQERIKNILDREADAIKAVKVTAEFPAAVMALRDCKGKVLTTGMGKAGHIARKFAATLCSTGTPAAYVHPGEAAHGALTYMKFANRESIDFPIVGIALWASTQQNDYRVAYTAVDRKPLLGPNIEACLQGKELSDENIAQACELAPKAAKPVKTSVYPASHKRKMMGLLLRAAAEKTRDLKNEN